MLAAQQPVRKSTKRGGAKGVACAERRLDVPRRCARRHIYAEHLERGRHRCSGQLAGADTRLKGAKHLRDSRALSRRIHVSTHHRRSRRARPGEPLDKRLELCQVNAS
eukprot:scaffold124233_cov18-Tisochrysis_lutea.AAC.1